jgi:hypothetical protein
MNKSSVPIKKGKFYQELANSIPELVFDLINIIYQYAKNENDHMERYHSTINCRDHMSGLSDKMTILGDSLYIIGFCHDTILVYDLKTYKLVNSIRGMNRDTFREYIKKYLCENEQSVCSGYHPYPIYPEYKKNFWSEICFDIVTSNDKYIFTWIHKDHLIMVEDKMIRKCVYKISEKYSLKKTGTFDWLNHKGKFEKKQVNVVDWNYKKNIMAHNNILYIIGNYLYKCIDEVGRNRIFEDIYIHLYNADTFQYIRELFTKTNNYNSGNIPLCMAVTDNNIIICRTYNEFEIWIKEDCF